MEIVIRSATAADYSAIYNLIKEFAVFQKTPQKATITLAQMESSGGLFQCLVAENNDKKIIGFASFYFTWFSWSGKGLYLDDLYVTEAYRKQKTGTRLLENVVSLAKAALCVKVRWQVSGWNKNAISFYKSIGAKIDDVEINCELSL